jgi:hypothetical protein
MSTDELPVVRLGINRQPPPPPWQSSSRPAGPRRGVKHIRSVTVGDDRWSRSEHRANPSDVPAFLSGHDVPVTAPLTRRYIDLSWRYRALGGGWTDVVARSGIRQRRSGSAELG